MKRVNKKWYSHKYKGPGVRYEVALVIKTGLIAWVNGPFPCGAFSDLKIFKLGLMLELGENERVEAGGGFKALDPTYCKNPCRYTSLVEKERQELANRVRARQETVNRRYKKWNILHLIYKHDVAQHMIVFHAISVVTQLEMKHGEPLFQVEYNPLDE